MLMVGLTGGIGAGKSAVARRLVRCGAMLIDSDQLAREVVASGTEGLTEVIAAFGAAVRGSDGELDRAAVGALVFGDDAARRRLEEIIHPRVRARSAELVAAAPADAVVVNDVPLLVEAGLGPTFHLVIVVESDEAVRVQRLVRTRGMTAEQALARIRAQAGDERRRAAADVVLMNGAGLAELGEHVDRCWHERLLPYEQNLRRRHPVPVAGAPRVVAPDPGWPVQAGRIAARIRLALRPILGVDAVVEHIGSTAVPQLPAKDVLDLMLVVDSLVQADAVAEALAQAGLPRKPGVYYDNARGRPGETWPKRLHGSADPARLVHLHVRVAGSPGWRYALLMRDHLRAVPAARDAYAAAKRDWTAAYADVGDYAAAKEPWFDAAAAQADTWAAQTGWTPGR